MEQMKWKSLFAAALSAVVAWPALAQDATGGGTPAEGGGLQQAPGTAPGRVISVNFGGGQSGVSPYAIPADTAYGLVSATNWNNTTTATGEAIALNASDGTASGATLTYAANGTWNDDAASTDPFLQYFLGDNREGGTTITVANVPFETYDVIVYLNSDTENTSFLPVSINGTKYIGDPGTGATVATEDADATFGQSRATTPTYGRNAIRVNGLTGDVLAIQGSKQKRQNDQPNGAMVARCNIAGFQIVESLPLSISVNLKGTANVNFPHYPETLVGDTTGFSGLVPVVNANWNEVETPAGNGSTPGISGAKDATGAETTATINLAIGGGWTLKGPSQEAQEVQNARTTRIGKMGLGYADASKNTTPEVTLSDIPYTEYSVILYYATDNGDKQWAPAKVTSGDTDTYYYYGEDETLKSDGTSTSTWGSSNYCIAAETTGTLGKDTMRIDGLSGDVSIDLDTSSNNTRGGLSGLQIVCTGKVIVPPPPSISVNVIGGNNTNSTWTALPSIKDTEGQSGLADYRVDNANWNELTQQNSGNTGGTPETLEAPVDNTGAPTFATVTARLGGWWHLKKTEASEAARMNAVGHMGVGFCDPSKVADTNELTLANVPYTKYSLILYYGTNNANYKWAAPKVTFADGTVKTYTYAADATGAATEGTDAWGSTTAATTSGQAGTLGKDVMLIEGLSGNISIDLGTQPNDGAATQAGSLCGFQIVCTGEVIPVDPAKKGVISLNFNSGTNNSAVPATETTYGLVAVPGSKWQNLTGTSNADGVAITTASNTDLTVTPTVTFSSTGGWQYDANQTTCPYLRAYLDDDGNTKVTGVDVDVANVPYQAYDVVVYFGMGDANNTFRPVAINGTYYRWDNTVGAAVPTEASGAAFGTSAQTEAAYGVNAIRVKAQTDNLDLDAQPRNPSALSERGGIAALQLVERKVIEVTGTGFDLAGALAAYEADTPVLITFTDGATVTGDVTLPADAVVDLTAYTFGETAPFGGALTVNEGSEIRLPGGAASYTLASSINGTLGLVMQGDTYITDASISGGTITRPVTYEWTGAGTDTNWTTAANWIDGEVPKADSAVTIPLTDGANKTITLTEGAVAGSLSIVGPDSGAPTLTINGTGALTVSGQMSTSGNVTVTQSADITVNGAATAAEGNVPAGYYAKGSFDVNGATYTLSAGTLTVANQTDCAFLVGNGATFTVGGGEEVATLSFPRTGVLHPIPSVDSRIIVAANGTLSSQSALDTPSDRYKWELAGGTLALATEAATRIRVYGGIEVSGDSTLSFVAQTANIIAMGENPSALTGEGDLALIGSGTFSFGTSTAVTSGAPLTGYTGELSVPSGLTLVLGEARPALTVAEGATVKITPSASEQVSGEVSFVTSMKTLPSATFTVEGVDAVTPEVDNGKLTLSWAASTATLATSGKWSADNWTVGETTGQAAPESGVVVLDGTAEGGITVTLDTAIPADITTINVKGDVTLVASDNQATLPTCINVEAGATLGVGADFAKAEGSAWPATWDIPANTTLRITGDGFDFGGITVDHNQYIQVYADLEVTATGTEGAPALIEPANNLWCRGKVTVSGSYVKLKKLYWLDDEVDGLTVTGDNVTIEGLRQVDGSEGLTLSGNNVTITGDTQGFAFAAGATITSSGTGNVLDGLTDLPTELHVTDGDLTIDSCATLGGALLTNGATLKLAADWAAGQELKVSAGDNSATTLDLSAINPANRPTLNRYSDTYKTLPKTIIVAPSVEETEAGVIDITLLQDLALAADAVVQVVADPAWNPAWEVVTEGGKKLRITNVVLKPVLPEGSTLSETATAALNGAASDAGITGTYAVAITTGGATVQVTTAEAATQLQEVLECFTGLTLKGDSTSNTVTVVYDFGVVGIKRNTTGDGWVVTAKVQGEGAAQAGFAKGNAYVLSVTAGGTEKKVQLTGESGVDETSAATGTVELTVSGTLLEGVGDGFTLGVSVSRNAPEL